MKIGVQRFHAVTWFGLLSCRKFERVSPKSSLVAPCKLCGEDMSRGYHVGKRDVVKHLGDKHYVKAFVDDACDESGNPNYVE